MYNVGEKIVYPMHGAGIIKAIEEKEILGKIQKYYILNISVSGISHMVPVITAESIGVRPVVSENNLKSVYSILADYYEETDPNWNKRYRENLKKLKTGQISEVAKVVSSLTSREKLRSLSTSEKKMLTNARHILTSELILVEKKELVEIEEKLDEILAI